MTQKSDATKRDNFDYTEWQRDLWKDKSIEEIHQMGVELERKNQAEAL